jgi:hypothetical protein
MHGVPSKKGLSLVAVRDYVVKTHGPGGWQTVLRALSPEDAEVMREVVGMGWYPLDLYGRLIRTVDRVLGSGDLAVIRAMSRFEADRDVPTIHRLLLRMVRQDYIVDKIAELWPRYNSTGRLSVEHRAARSVEVVLSDWSSDEAQCLAIQSYSERAFELAGAKGVRVAQPSCRARGARACVFRVNWGPSDSGRPPA